MKKAFLVCMLFLKSWLVPAQTRQIDSMFLVLKNTTADTQKINLLNKLSWELINTGHYDTAMQCAVAANSLAKKIDFKKGIAYSHNYIGVVHKEQGKYPEALKNHFACLKILEEISDKKGMARSYNNIANIYFFQKNFKEALKIYRTSLAMALQMNSKMDIARAYSGIGSIYYNLENYAEALKNYQACLKLSEEIDYKQGISAAAIWIGNIYASLGKYKESLQYYFASLKVEEKMGDKASVSWSYMNIAVTFTKLKKFKDAEIYSSKSLALAAEIGLLELIKEANSVLSDTYAYMGDYKKSLQYYKAFVTAKDSLLNEENTRQTVQTQMQYEFDKKETATKLKQEKHDAIAKAESKKQKIIILSVSAGLFLILILAVVILRSLRLNQRKNKIITLQKELVEHQKELVEEKQKEILDSIHYAKRIQTALLPHTIYIEKTLNRLLKNTFLFLLLFASLHSISQIKKADSLANELKKVTIDTSKIKLLNAIAWELRNKNTDSSITLTTHALHLAEKNNWQKGIAKSFHQLGEFNWRKDNYDVSLGYYLKALALWKTIYPPQGGQRAASTLGNIGLVYYSMGDYPKALNYYFEALKMAEGGSGAKIDKDGISRQLGNIAIVYYEQKNYEKALEYNLKALEISQELNDKYGIAIYLSNSGGVYMELKNYPKALEYDLMGLKLAEELENKNGISSGLGNIANVYTAQALQARESKDMHASDSLFKIALLHYAKALKIAEQSDDKNLISLWAGNLGVLYSAQHKLAEAGSNLKRALSLAEEIGDLDGIKEWNKNLSEVYNAKGDWKTALVHYKNYINARDSIFNDENTKKTVQTQMQYEFDKKESATKLEQDKRDAVAAAESRKQKIIIYAVTFGLLLILILAVVILRSLRINKKKNRIISLQKEAVERQKAHVEEKQKEILDSIHYAKRIQTALLPTEKYILKYLRN
jgi:tetratricopeptide (TPR) repeat protein